MICRIYDIPGATLEQYDCVDAQVGPVEPEGFHLHVAGATNQGLMVIELWDSADHVQRFMASSTLGQALQEAGIPEPVVTDFEVHKLQRVG